MIELRLGYWRTRDGRNAFVFGKNPLSDGDWVGTVSGEGAVSWCDNGRYFSDDECKADLVEYFGPFMPPDPGDGYRLLKKWPEPEPVENGDEFLNDDGVWDRSNNWQTQDNGIQATFWYRRRIAPTPPVPPDGYELCPDGTPWQEGFKRCVACDPADLSAVEEGWADAGTGWKRDISGWWVNGGFLWYARPIPWEPTGAVRVEYYAWYGDGTARGKVTHRELRRGDETKWEPTA